MKVDPRFEALRGSLFPKVAGEYNRTLLTKEQNKELDVSLERMIRGLSPFMLLPATHKVLEYFIRWFQINEFNADVTLMARLPFHETNVFVRMLQLVDVRFVPHYY